METHMTRTITVAGARGGSGASTVAAGIALYTARHASTELVAAELDTTAALLGLAGTQDARTAIAVADRLTLTATPTGSAEIAVIDAQRLDQLDTQPAGLLLIALRGPCYLGLRTITTTTAVRADGIVLLAEPGRSLTRRDVSDVCDVPVMAEIAVTANVARTIDAGLLVTRLHQLREFAALRRYLDRLIDPHDNEAPAPDTAVSHARPSRRKTSSTIATDLPVPLSGTGRPHQGTLWSLHTTRACRDVLFERHGSSLRTLHDSIAFGRARPATSGRHQLHQLGLNRILKSHNIARGRSGTEIRASEMDSVWVRGRTEQRGHRQGTQLVGRRGLPP